MTKHTPGPWKADGRKIAADGYGLIAIVDEWSPEVDAADAALIAAAPDLLEALKAFDEFFGDRYINTGAEFQALRGKARAAISKAEAQS